VTNVITSKGMSSNSEFIARLAYLRNSCTLQYVREPEKLIESIDRIAEQTDEPDMHAIKLIRFLYLSSGISINSSINIDDKTKARMVSVLSAFPYWSHEKTPSDVVFWSENHIMMMLSSAHLMRQYICIHDTSNSNKTISQQGMMEEKLLRLYLEGKKKFGLYECLSHVYLPYTISSLLNLYDFSIDRYIQSLASDILNIIVKQILLCTTTEGIATLCASSRSFHRTRTRIRGHNINELIYLYTGKGEGHSDSFQLSDFLITTTWIPDDHTFDAYHFKGFLQQKVSHNINEIRLAYMDPTDPIDPIELVPFYWSAGLLYHKNFIFETKKYVQLKKLEHKNDLYPLFFVPTMFVSSISKSLERISSGQCYLGVTLNVYKDRNICLSSFENFQVNSASFQQLSWMANIEGLPVWSTSGKGSESFAGFSMNNTYNPYCSQSSSLLVVSYYPRLTYRNEVVQLFWPSSLFDDEKRDCEWWIGRKIDSFIGIYCTAPTRLDSTDHEDCLLETLYEPKTYCVRRICSANRLSFIVLVGTKDEGYDTIDTFLTKCKSIRIHESFSQKKYTVSVSDNSNERNINITL